jgi:hypothetical protein
MATSSARVPIGYIRDRTAAYKEKWNALHPKYAVSSLAVPAYRVRVGPFTFHEFSRARAVSTYLPLTYVTPSTQDMPVWPFVQLCVGSTAECQI